MSISSEGIYIYSYIYIPYCAQDRYQNSTVLGRSMIGTSSSSGTAIMINAVAAATYESNQNGVNDVDSNRTGCHGGHDMYRIVTYGFPR
jgi:hypothetical protein